MFLQVPTQAQFVSGSQSEQNDKFLKNLEAEHKNNCNSQHAKFFQNFLQFLFLDQKELFVHVVEAVFFQIRI